MREGGQLPGTCHRAICLSCPGGDYPLGRWTSLPWRARLRGEEAEECAILHGVKESLSEVTFTVILEGRACGESAFLTGKWRAKVSMQEVACLGKYLSSLYILNTCPSPLLGFKISFGILKNVWNFSFIQILLIENLWLHLFIALQSPSVSLYFFIVF